MLRIILFVLALGAIGLGCNSLPAPEKTGFEGTTLPNVNVLLPDSSHFDTKNIPAGQPTVLFVYSTSCPYCRAQLREMTENIEELKNMHVYMMTIARFKDFKNFNEEFKISKYPTITSGLDYTDSLGRYFKLKGVPFTAVYTPQKKLVAAFHGRITVDQIKDAAGRD